MCDAPAAPRLAGDTARWRHYPLAPALAVYLALTLLPIANLLVMSVHDIRWEQGAAQWTFAGLEHYAELPRDQLFRAGLVNTALFAVLAVSARAGARVLPRAVRRAASCAGRLFYRTSSCCRSCIPGIVIGAIWKLMYNPDFGVINQLLGASRPPGARLARREVARVRVGGRRRHLALDAVRVPAAARRARVAAAGRVRGGEGRRRERLGRSCAT